MLSLKSKNSGYASLYAKASGCTEYVWLFMFGMCGKARAGNGTEHDSWE